MCICVYLNNPVSVKFILLCLSYQNYMDGIGGPIITLLHLILFLKLTRCFNSNFPPNTEDMFLEEKAKHVAVDGI